MKGLQGSEAKKKKREKRLPEGASKRQREIEDQNSVQGQIITISNRK